MESGTSDLCGSPTGEARIEKALPGTTPQTLCEVLPMPIYTSGLLEAKPNSLLGFMLLTLSSSEPHQLLNHHLPPTRADLASLLLQEPQSRCHVAGNVSATPSGEHSMFHIKLPVGFHTPDKLTECGAVTKRHPSLHYHSNRLLAGTFLCFFFQD